MRLYIYSSFTTNGNIMGTLLGAEWDHMRGWFNGLSFENGVHKWKISGKHANILGPNWGDNGNVPATIWGYDTIGYTINNQQSAKSVCTQWGACSTNYGMLSGKAADSPN